MLQVHAEKSLVALHEKDGALELQIHVEDENDVRLELDKLFLARGEVPLVLRQAHHSVEGGLDRLLQLGRHQHARECQPDQARARLLVDGKRGEVSVRETARKVERFFFVAHNFVHLGEDGDHLEANFLGDAHRVDRQADVVADCALFRERVLVGHLGDLGHVLAPESDFRVTRTHQVNDVDRR